MNGDGIDRSGARRSVRTSGGRSSKTCEGGEGVARSSRPHTLAEILSRCLVDEMPVEQPLETPLIPAAKRRRVWNPPRPGSPHPSTSSGGAQSSSGGPSSEPGSPSSGPGSPSSGPGSPSSGGGALRPGTPPPSTSSSGGPSSGPGGPSSGGGALRSVECKRRGKRARTQRRPMKTNDDIAMLNLGSEEDSDSSDEEDMSLLPPIPRRVRVVWETPLDEDSSPEDSDVDAPVRPSVSAPGSSTSAPGPSAPAELLTSNVADPLNAATPTPTFQPTDLFEFHWRPFPNTPIQPRSRRETFSDSKSGPNTPLYDSYDLFTAIWDRAFMEHIALETNRYAEQLATSMMRANVMCPSSRICDWRDTTADELYVFFAMIMAMGLTMKSRLPDFWSTEPHILTTPGFRTYMSLRRFQLLSRCLHFCDNDDMCVRDLDASQAKLFKVAPIINLLNDRFAELYSLGQNIALDESLLQWKGWLDINQFIPNKAAAVGIKTYELCESQTGYLWRFEVHAHKRASSGPRQGDILAQSTPSIVMRLVQGLEHKGHTLWMDNFYNSPALARRLKSIGFDCVGTLRTNRQFVPAEVSELTKNNMQRGDVFGCTSGDVDLIVWRDQNRVAMISTYHGIAKAVSSDGNQKPIVIHDYNVCMGGVDKKDQMLANYPIERKKTRVWYKKLFRRLLNVSILNCYIIHKQSPNCAKPLTHHNFRLNLVSSLLSKHSCKTAAPPLPISSYYECKTHFAKEFGFLPDGKTRLRSKCRVCRKRTQTFCVACDKPVCVIGCFRDLHS